ncbi:hypothetical protein PFLUV_G00027540 [Perca fluviatilis]|uniref:CCHC-type domain-containing protein n=1 Tax=Perca fluviatilis TaxID=8168 RepID=A0A6A5ESF5_PERFL|nr:hypothetical protein PFLUV_G00027540 [Perca fluviatilis]
MPKIHPETKVLIIKRLKTRSTADVADTFNVSQRQLQRIKKTFEDTGDVFDKPRSGRPRKTTAREDCLLARKSKASPFATAAELHETCSPEVPVSTRTVCRILSRNGLHGRISAQKPALNKRQLKNRVAFAKAHSLLKGWTLEKWKKVDFSDESSVELHHSRRKYCRRPTGARMDLRFTQRTVKFGGGKIMVWGYIQYGGVREICRSDAPTRKCVRSLGHWLAMASKAGFGGQRHARFAASKLKSEGDADAFVTPGAGSSDVNKDGTENPKALERASERETARAYVMMPTPEHNSPHVRAAAEVPQTPAWAAELTELVRSASRSTQRRPDRTARLCWGCRKPGHLICSCPKNTQTPGIEVTTQTTT